MSEAIDKNKKKRRKNRKLKIFLSVLLLLTVFFICGGIYVYSTLNKMTAKVPEYMQSEEIYSIDESNKIIDDNKIAERSPLELLPSKPANPCNILILGADYIAGENTDVTKRRTDTMIVAHYDPFQDKLLGVAIPRDTKVKINNRIQKLNAVNEIGGPKLVINTLKDIINVNIDNYVIVDYVGFNRIIDAIGGVDLTIPQRMKYDDNSQNYHIDYQKGQQVHLDGKEAEYFFRWRQNNHGIQTETIDAGGDLGRIENQRVLMRAVIDKVSKPGIIPKIPSLLDNITDSIVTDLSPSEMIKYGFAFSSIGNNNTKFITLKGQFEHTNAWYYIMDFKRNIDIINTLNNNAPYIDRQGFKITLVNESGRSIAPINIKQYLTKNSPYMSTNITSIKGETAIPESYVEVYDIDEKYNDIILNDFRKFNITKIVNMKGKDRSDIIVHIGKDYK